MPRNKISPLELKAREDISNNLKYYSRGLTQKQLSEKTGIPTSTISGYFAKRSTPNAGAVQKLADALGVNKSDIDPRYKNINKKQKHTDLSVDQAIDGLRSYQGKPISDDQKEIIKDLIKGYLDRSN
ncbi:helix-turn-helix domain-containing protein [Limosilactobacillus caecicola]|uniref:helix-turn-helix domain-containing protein n=1 Tax=Limosilactobacillus caecicola TaxID=2941332 RepID=UPI00203C6D1F|nr:helix-turn-helix transcriptional regulator [Limosilactobacillus caecicola]